MSYLICSTATADQRFIEWIATASPLMSRPGRSLTIKGGAGLAPRVSQVQGVDKSPKTQGHQVDFVTTTVSDEDFAWLSQLPAFTDMVEKGWLSVRQIKKEMRASAIDSLVEEEMLGTMKSWKDNPDRQLTAEDFESPDRKFMGGARLSDRRG